MESELGADLYTSGLSWEGGGLHSAGGILGRLRFRNGVRFGESIGRWTILLFSDTDCIQLCTLYDSWAHYEEGVFLLLRLRFAIGVRVFGFSFGLAVGVGNDDPLRVRLGSSGYGVSALKPVCCVFAVFSCKTDVQGVMSRSRGDTKLVLLTIPLFRRIYLAPLEI
jgi:hypothetical protein